MGLARAVRICPGGRARIVVSARVPAVSGPLRAFVFALSLIGLLWCLRGSRLTKVHPSWIMLVIAAFYMAIMIFHPATNTTMAGVAQIGMHLAVAAPLFWAPRYFRGDYRRLLRILTILWVLNGAGALVGIMQVRDPGTWMPTELSTAVKMSKPRSMMYQYQMGRWPDGDATSRPGRRSRLCEQCRPVCRGRGARLPGTAGITTAKASRGLMVGVAGIIVIFLSHIRSALVVVIGCGLVYSIIMIWQGRVRTVLGLAMLRNGCGVLRILLCRSLRRERDRQAVRHPDRGRSFDGLRKIRPDGHGYRCFRHNSR